MDSPGRATQNPPRSPELARQLSVFPHCSQSPRSTAVWLLLNPLDTDQLSAMKSLCLRKGKGGAASHKNNTIHREGVAGGILCTQQSLFLGPRGTTKINSWDVRNCISQKKKVQVSPLKDKSSTKD